MLTIIIGVIILQYIQVLNHYVVCLKLICYLSIIPQLKKKVQSISLPLEPEAHGCYPEIFRSVVCDFLRLGHKEYLAASWLSSSLPLFLLGWILALGTKSQCCKEASSHEMARCRCSCWQY